MIINAIQYQCSLGEEKSKYKEKIFRECWKNQVFKDDFIKRLKSCSPILIINCCTGQIGGKISGLQKSVQIEIDKNFPNTYKIFGYHPSTYSFLRGFKKCP